MLDEKDLQAIAQMMKDMEDRLDAKMDAKLAPINDRLDRMEGRLDLDIGKQLDALAEGQSVIEERLDAMSKTLGEVKDLAEKTSDRVDVIHAVVSQHSGSITELKKARG